RAARLARDRHHRRPDRVDPPDPLRCARALSDHRQYPRHQEFERRMTMRTIRVLVADPQPLTRFATCELLRRAEDIIVVGDAGNGEDAIRSVKARRPEVAVLAMQLAPPPGTRVRGELSGLAARIVALSNVTSEHHVAEALRYGAYGYLTTEATPEHILQAI